MNKICNNYFSGPVNQVSNCLEIILFNSYSMPERISLYNLKNFYLKYLVGSSGEYVKLVRDNSEVAFEYKKSLEKGFDILVFISPISNSPIGYSEFVNVQGVDVSLGITINITRTLKGELELILKNQLTGKDLAKVYLGDELYNYVPRKKIVERNYRNLFTSDIKRLESDRFGFDVGSSWVSTIKEFWKIDLRKNIIISEEYENYNICFYDGDLVLATWEGVDYSLYFLTSLRETKRGTTGTYGIKRIEGRYFFDTDNILRDLETMDEVVKKKEHQVCDYLNPHCYVYDLPTFYLKSELLKYIPEINNIYLDLDNYLRSNQVALYKKIGSWFILERDFGGVPIYCAVSPTSIINMTGEDLEKALFVGDQTVILCENGENPYYVLYNIGGTELYTERARSILLNGRLDLYENPEFLFCFLDTEEDDVHFTEYYGENGLAHLIFEYEDLHLTILGKYRRNAYPSSSSIPKLIGSFGGQILYREDTKLNWL